MAPRFLPTATKTTETALSPDQGRAPLFAEAEVESEDDRQQCTAFSTLLCLTDTRTYQAAVMYPAQASEDEAIDPPATIDSRLCLHGAEEGRSAPRPTAVQTLSTVELHSLGVIDDEDKRAIWDNTHAKQFLALLLESDYGKSSLVSECSEVDWFDKFSQWLERLRRSEKPLPQKIVLMDLPRLYGTFTDSCTKLFGSAFVLHDSRGKDGQGILRYQCDP